MRFSSRFVLAATAAILFISAAPVNAAPAGLKEYPENYEGGGDVPTDMKPIGGPAPENDGESNPEAQTLILAPVVLSIANTKVWKFTDFSPKSLLPFGLYRDTYGSGNRQWVADPKDPKKIVLRVNYPKGTTTPSSIYNPPGAIGGTGFYAQPIAPILLSTAKTVSLEYSVYFPPEFDWVRGGKLPGLYGSDGTKAGCSGGSTATNCFSARFMWRKLGDGEAYLYTPQDAVQDAGYCKIPPLSVCDPAYGDSIARGSIKFTKGAWTTIKEEVRVNAIPGQQTGGLKLWLNGKLVAQNDKIVWRINNGVFVQGFAFETFFGGSTADWATPVDQYTLFKDFSMVATY